MHGETLKKMSEYYLHTNCTFIFTKQQLVLSFMLARSVELEHQFTCGKRSVSRDGCWAVPFRIEPVFRKNRIFWYQYLWCVVVRCLRLGKWEIWKQFGKMLS